MINRIYKLLKLFWEYIYKGTISITTKQASLHLDEEGNLFILPNNLVLQSKGYNFIDCDPSFTALAISYSKRGETEKLEALINNRLKALQEDIWVENHWSVDSVGTDNSTSNKARIGVTEEGKVNVSS